MNKRGRARKRQREGCKMVKKQIWYYLHNMRSAYILINRRLHRKRERQKERERQRERKR